MPEPAPAACHPWRRPRGFAAAAPRAAAGRAAAAALAAALLALLALYVACTVQPPPHASALGPTGAGAAAKAHGTAAQWRHEWVRGAVFYEVFVRSFADADGDGKGDLRGLIAKLDYLNSGDPRNTDDLKVDALWLMPVFRSPSYHGYDTVDYEAIHPDYGTGADFDRLLREAHRRGIKVIVDLVLNHTSSQHPWFVEALASPLAPHRPWYVWRDDDPGWTQPWGGINHTWHAGGGAYYYGVFWSGMPDLNYRTPAVREEMKRVAAAWLRRGVDGFRLDATRHLVEDGPGALQTDTPETHAYLKELSASVRQLAPRSMLVGENWTQTPIIATYFGSTAEVAEGDELPMSFDFPLAEAIVAGVRAGDAGPIAAKLEEIARLYPPGIIDAPFLTNHDQIRLATQLDGDARRLRSAAAVLLTLPGAPFLYYGEEIGLANGPGSDDRFKRTPMPWNGEPGGGFSTGNAWFDFAPGREAVNVAAETHDPQSLLSHYRRLIRARHRSAALSRGDLVLLTATAASAPTPVLAFLRRAPDGREAVVAVHNLSDQPAVAGPYQLVPPAPLGGRTGAPARSLEPLLAAAGAEARSTGDGLWSFTLPAGASAVWRLR